MRKQFVIAILGAVSLAASYCAWAQPLLDAPPPYQAETWRSLEVEASSEHWTTTFPSAKPSGVIENDTVPVHLYLPRIRLGQVPCVLILHYWGATDSRVEANMARELARRGIAGAFIPLPYHISRTPKGKRSGENAIVPDPAELVKTMTQSISDIRRAYDVISQRPEIDATRLGITGTSLGAVVASLASGIDTRIQHGAYVVGGADLAHILWHSSRVVLQRDQFRKLGYTESKLRELLMPIEPLEYLQNRTPVSAYVVGAKFDTVIPPSDTQKLIEALGNPHVVQLETGHYGGFFIQKRVQASVADYFSKSFAGQTFQAPAQITAPTFRLGVVLSPEDELQIGVGVDLIRPRDSNGIFGALIATPEDFSFYFGKPIDGRLSVGMFFRSEGVTFGLMWSVVL